MNLVGNRFGKLTVISKTDHCIHGSVAWLCKCDCGNSIEVSTRDLNRGAVKSCGCLKKERCNLVGRRFGRLTVIKKESYGSHSIYLCKCDCGNIVDLFDVDNKVAITDPVYPVYLDTNVMSGRSGKYNEEKGIYENIVYLPVTAENNFKPEIPKEKVDMIYLCFPNNPTGTVLEKEDLKVWIDYAKENKSIILYDSAYEAFIKEDNIPHSIYEIEGAKDVAIEFKSFSKTAGFTGLRCAYIVIPKTVKGYTENGEEIDLNRLWNRRTCTKFNGVSYIVQRAAEATYTLEGRKQIKENIGYYKENAKIIKNGLEEAGFTVYGAVNSPYIWLKVPKGMTSWEFFDKLLAEVNIVGTPGSGFGPHGEGYFRLTAFGTKENTLKAIERIKNWNIR